MYVPELWRRETAVSGLGAKADSYCFRQTCQAGLLPTPTADALNARTFGLSAFRCRWCRRSTDLCIPLKQIYSLGTETAISCNMLTLTYVELSILNNDVT
jgi:hypothetical protein